MNSVAITGSCYHTLENRAPKLARERHAEFYRDLYRLYGKTITESTFCEGPGYSYTELGAPVLDFYAKSGELQDLELIVVVYWSHEFDPDHSSCGPFFAYHYNIKGQIFDICDQGSVSLFTALNTIQQYMRYGAVKKAMLLALEQTSIPRNKTDYALMPNINAAAALVIKTQESSIDGYVLLNSKLILEHEICTAPFNAVQFLEDKCKELNITANQLTVVLKKSSFFFKNYQCNSAQEPVFCLSLQIMTIDPGNGFMPVLFYLNELIHSSMPTSSHIIVIDEDVESLNTGYLILCRT